MGQRVTSEGFFGYDPAVGDLQVAHFGPEYSSDSWMQGGLTIEGKVSNFDIVYAGAFMKRNLQSIADYSDYSYFYDKIDGYGASWTGSPTAGTSGGSPIMPQELVVSNSSFEKFSHELRVSTPQDLPVKATVGLFIQRQQHRISEDYVMPGFGFSSPYGNPDSPTPNADGLDLFLLDPGTTTTRSGSPMRLASTGTRPSSVR